MNIIIFEKRSVIEVSSPSNQKLKSNSQTEIRHKQEQQEKEINLINLFEQSSNESS